MGIETILPISQYEHIEQQNLIRILSEKPTIKNPLDSVVRSLLLRAQFNSHRHYEIYAIDCAESMDEEFWREQWEEFPQATAELIRERGQKLFSNRAETHRIKIT